MTGVQLARAIALATVALASGACGDGGGDGPAPAANAVTADTARGTSTNDLPRLIGTVGAAVHPDAYAISLRTEDGTEITTTLLSGRYVLELDDRSTIHNFHLRGRYGGADVATDVERTGKETFTVLLNEPESYNYFCDAHPTRMNVTFSIHERIRTQN